MTYKIPLVLACLGILLFAIINESRLLLIVRPTIASAGLLIMVASLGVGFVVNRYNWNSLGYGLFVIFSALMSLLWLTTFTVRTGWPTDYRALAMISGLFCFFPAYALFLAMGTERGLILVSYLLATLMCLYLAAAIIVVVFDGLQNAPDRSLILNDGFRGRRIYMPAAFMITCLFLAIAKARMRGRLPLTSGMVLGTIACFILAQSRVGGTIAAILLILYFYDFRRLTQAVLFTVVTATLVLGTIVALAARGYLQSLDLGELSSLTLRLDNYKLAMDILDDNPILGLGIASNEDQLMELFGSYFYFDDLGPIGILATGGIVGYAFYLLIGTLAFRASSQLMKSDELLTRALGYSVGFPILYMVTYPDIIFGSGSIILAIALAAAAAPETLSPADSARLRPTARLREPAQYREIEASGVER